MEQILVDSSAIYALLDRSDANHSEAVRILAALSRTPHSIYVTDYIVAESHALILGRLGHALARRWLTSLAWHVESVTAMDLRRGTEIVLTYADKTFSLTDAVSFAVMDRMQSTYAFAFDRHFVQFGLSLISVGHPLLNVD